MPEGQAVQIQCPPASHWVPLALAHLSKDSQPHLCLVLWSGQAEAARRREEELVLVETREGREASAPPS